MFIVSAKKFPEAVGKLLSLTLWEGEIPVTMIHTYTYAFNELPTFLSGDGGGVFGGWAGGPRNPGM